MMLSEIEMVELLKVLQQNPEGAAKALAASGLRPDQLLNVGNMGLGSIAAPASERAISSAPPRYMGTFEGSAVRNDLPPSNQFTPPAANEVQMPLPVVTTNATDNPHMDYLWNQPLPIETAATGAAPATAGAVVPNAAAGAVVPGANNIGMLMSGLKGLSTQSSDARPIFGANAPAPRDIPAVKQTQPMSMQNILQLLTGNNRSAMPVPSIGALMGR